jgi:hypothetical protein
VFDTQRIRLLRRSWPTPDMLAEELYAMFGDPNVVHNGTITLNNPSNQPGVVINQPGGSGSSAQPILVNYPADTYPNEQSPAPGQSNYGSTKVHIELQRHDFAGVITGGSGDTYQVQLFDNRRGNLDPTTQSIATGFSNAMAGTGVSNGTPSDELSDDAPDTIEAKVFQIASGQTIPAGTAWNPFTRYRKIKVTTYRGRRLGLQTFPPRVERTILSEEWFFQIPVFLCPSS